MNLIKRNQIDHDDGAAIGQNGGTHWHIIQRMLLRLQLTACQSKNERELKKAKDYGHEWKKRYFELKSVADKMMEQFEHESAVQKSIIGSVKKRSQNTCSRWCSEYDVAANQSLDALTNKSSRIQRKESKS